MWINKKRRRAYWLPIVLPAAFDSKLVECDAMKWNEMEWRVFCTLDNKKLSRTTQLSVWTGEETGTRLTSSSSPFSRRISGMLCSMCRPERNWLPLEKCARKCRKSKSKRPRNPAASLSHRSNSLPPFFTDEGTLATDTNWFQWNFS